MQILVQGDGVAAYCCAHLLKTAGFRVILRATDRPRLPAIMLGDAALALIRDVFGQKNLLRELPRIEKRVVAWEPHSVPITVEHSAVVISEQSLLENLQPFLEKYVRDDNDIDWTIFASRPLPAESIEHRFGSRSASAVAVALTHESAAGACFIESMENGWLFLIPNAPGSGWLMSVGGAPDALLGRSQVVARQIMRSGVAAAQFPAYPRIMSPLCGPGWLACGTAAMAFDPICGDGTAHALREAILAAAVVRALSKNFPADQLFSHYQTRLTLGFKRHLVLCREFYRSVRRGPWWDSELDSLEQGLAWCDRALDGHLEFRYQLKGFELEPVR